MSNKHVESISFSINDESWLSYDMEKYFSPYRPALVLNI